MREHLLNATTLLPIASDDDKGHIKLCPLVSGGSPPHTSEGLLTSSTSAFSTLSQPPAKATDEDKKEEAFDEKLCGRRNRPEQSQLSQEISAIFEAKRFKPNIIRAPEEPQQCCSSSHAETTTTESYSLPVSRRESQHEQDRVSKYKYRKNKKEQDMTFKRCLKIAGRLSEAFNGTHYDTLSVCKGR